MTSADSTSDRRSRVLVAEDDKDIRELVTRKLLGAGYDVNAVADGPSALREAQSLRPDVAVFDVTMPGLSGLALITALRSEPATANLPVILLTARSEEFEVSAGLSQGATAYMVKPFSPRELLERVQAIISSTTADTLASP